MSIVNVPPSEAKSQKNVVYRFLGNAFVQAVLVFVALAVAFSGKLDSQGTLVAILVAWMLGSIGIYSHCSATTTKKIAAGVMIVVYGSILWVFYGYLTSKPPQIVATNLEPPPKTQPQTTEAPPKPERSPPVSTPKPGPQSASGVKLPPAGFVTFLGQVLNGYAPMVQENQTETPLDNVHLSVTEFFPKADDPNSRTVAWQKEIDIGTVRARLTMGLSDRFPVMGEERIGFDVFIATRFQSYRETIQLTKENDKQYKAELNFYDANPKPLYTETKMLSIVNF